MFKKLFDKFRGSQPVEVDPVLIRCLAQVMVRARDEAQRIKVMSALKQMRTTSTDQDELRVMAMMEGCYPHLEKLADFDRLSAEWVEEYAKVLEFVNENIDNLIKEQEEEHKLFDELLGEVQDKPDEIT